MQKQVDYKQAVKTRYPEQVVLAIAKDKNGRPNPMVIGWTMVTSGSPPMMAIAVAHKRYTAEAIRHSRCFTIVYPCSGSAKETLFFGTESGRDTDKLAQMATAIAPADKIDSVILTDAVANFECALESETTAGDHIIFIGKVVASHINTEPKKRLYTIASGHKLGGIE